MEQRKELAYERHTLPSRFWEPEPDEEDLERMKQDLMDTIGQMQTSGTGVRKTASKGAD